MNSVKKIVAIGGGENGRTNSKGEALPYELAEIDEEIVMLSGKEKPNVLFLAHAQITFGDDYERRYYETMRRIYAERLGCPFRWLKAAALEEYPEAAQRDVRWADIVYEGGGDTIAMIGLWKRTGFDNCLREAWEAGKVMCGVSAGAICWFSSGNTLAPDYREKEVNEIPGLGFVDAYLSPHCNAEGKRESELRSLRHINKVGLSLSNCAAIEIVDDGYRILKSTPADAAFRPYALRTFRKDGVMHEEELSESDDMKPLGELLELKSL